MEEKLCSVIAQDKAGPVSMSMVNLISTEDGGKRGRKIWQDTGHTNNVCLSRHFFKGKGLLDSFLGTG